ncbi:hypothetical protein Dimus_037274, partial [Dionaea muscipula]
FHRPPPRCKVLARVSPPPRRLSVVQRSAARARRPPPPRRSPCSTAAAPPVATRCSPGRRPRAYYLPVASTTACWPRSTTDRWP